MGTSGGLSQQQKFWVLKSLWNLLGLTLVRPSLGGRRNHHLIASCFCATELEFQDLLFLNGDTLCSPVQELQDNFCIPSGATAQDSYRMPFHFFKNCSTSSKPAAIQGHPGGSRYWTSVWQREEVPPFPFCLRRSPSPSVACLTHHP